MAALRDLRLHRERPYYLRDPGISHEGLHQVLWQNSDDRHRIPIRLVTWAERYDVSSSTIAVAIKAMRKAGRIRALDRAPGKGPLVYEIADPARWDPDDSATHARRGTTPVWG